MKRLILELQIDVDNWEDEAVRLKLMEEIGKNIPMEICISEENYATIGNTAFSFLKDGSKVNRDEIEDPFKNVQITE